MHKESRFKRIRTKKKELRREDRRYIWFLSYTKPQDERFIASILINGPMKLYDKKYDKSKRNDAIRKVKNICERIYNYKNKDRIPYMIRKYAKGLTDGIQFSRELSFDNEKEVV